MRIELPSGGWVEYRDMIKGKDKFAVQRAIRFTVDQGRQQEVSAGVSNNMRNALLYRVIDKWSYGPAPSETPIDFSSPYAMEQLEDLFDIDIDDYNAIQKAVEPLFEKVSFAGPNQ